MEVSSAFQPKYRYRRGTGILLLLLLLVDDVVTLRYVAGMPGNGRVVLLLQGDVRTGEHGIVSRWRNIRFQYFGRF